MLWVIDKLRKLCRLVGGLCLLALIAGVALAATGDDSFTAPLSQAQTGFGRSALETGAIVLGAFVAWRPLTALGMRLVVARLAREGAEYPPA